MSAKKKSVRKDFRDAVFQRDGYTCQGCGYKPPKGEPVEEHLDAHHITDRHDMPNGGYVPKNGVSLCKVVVAFPGDKNHEKTGRLVKICLEAAPDFGLYRSSEPKAPTSGTPEATCQASDRRERDGR